MPGPGPGGGRSPAVRGFASFRKIEAKWKHADVEGGNFVCADAGLVREEGLNVDMHGRFQMWNRACGIGRLEEL